MRFCRNVYRSLRIGCVATFLSCIFCISTLSAESDEAFSRVSGWPALQAGISFGQITGVAVASDNRVFVFHRADREWTNPFPSEKIQAETIFVLDPVTGKLTDSWGADMFIMPHGLAIDAEDNVWVTDVGSHQVHKFSNDGEFLLSLGEEGVQGNDDSHFAAPTDVAFSTDGSVFVSDGYINARIVKYSPAGEFLLDWGRHGQEPGMFNLPHGIATDERDRVYVADRGNSRLQIFDTNGVFLEAWDRERVGRPYGAEVTPEGDVIVIDGGDQPSMTRVRVLKLNEAGEVCATIDARQEEDLRVLGHDIAVGPDGALYVADTWANRIQKYSAD